MAFPSILSTFNRPNATDRLNSPSHSALHNTVSSALGQVEAVIGVDGVSSIIGTIIGDLRSPGSPGGGHVQTAIKGGTGQTIFTKGDLLVASSSTALSKLSIGSDTTALVADSTQATGVRWGSSGKFGGTGADGALNLTSGATNINLANAAVVVKNYTSISITGTGSLTFTNPNTNGTTIILKSQENVTLTSSTAPMIVGSGNGAAATTSAYSMALIKANNGTDATAYNAPGAAGAAASLNTVDITASELTGKYPAVVPGAGGGAGLKAGGGGGGTAYQAGNAGSAGGNAADSGSGAGGRGGGSIIIECGSSWNFTTASGISVNGNVGTAGTGANGGGGGGGGAGIFLAFYTALTANSGTITVTGGTGGAGSGTGGAGGNGGSGYSLVASNTEFA